MSGSWQPFTLSMIPGVPEALQAVDQASSTLTGLLDALAEVLTALSNLALLLADTMQATINALCLILQEIIDQLFNLLNSNLAFYLDKGPLVSGARPDGLSGFLSRWRASFDDLGDKHRPQFAGNASISAMLFLVGAKDLPSLQRLLSLLGTLFGRADLSWEEEMTSFDLPARIEAGMSTPPDWQAARLGEVIPPLETLGEILLKAIGMLSVPDGYAGMIQELAEVVSSKALALQALSEEIDALVADINALMESSGLYVLPLQGQGLPELIAQAQSAMNPPAWDAQSYVAGVCLLAGTADFSAVASLFGGG